MITIPPGMSKLETVDQFTYVNATRCREFIMSLSTVLKGKLWRDILDSPFVSVLIDESTDISTSSLNGNYDLYFQAFKRKVSVQLLVDDYGLYKTWVVFKPKPKK